MRRTQLITSALVALTAAPAVAGELNIYSQRQPELIAPIVDAFAAKTGTTVNVAFLEDGLVERLQAEGDRSPADLVLTVDISRLAAVVEAGVTQNVTSPALEAGIPAQYRGEDGAWWGVTSRARVVYAANDRVQDADITTYEDLADPKWAGRICTRSGTHAYMIGLTSAMIAHHGEAETKTWLEGLKANLARKPQGNDRAQVKAIWAGECDISLANTYYMGAMLEDAEQAEWANSVRLLFPVFENGGTHVNVSGVAMTKAAKNKDTALAFMEYLASAEAQEIYALVNHEYPVTPGAEASALVSGWGEFTADDVNLGELAGLRAAALRLTEEVGFDQ